MSLNDKTDEPSLLYKQDSMQHFIYSNLVSYQLDKFSLRPSSAAEGPIPFMPMVPNGRANSYAPHPIGSMVAGRPVKPAQPGPISRQGALLLSVSLSSLATPQRNWAKQSHAELVTAIMIQSFLNRKKYIKFASLKPIWWCRITFHQSTTLSNITAELTRKRQLWGRAKCTESSSFFIRKKEERSQKCKKWFRKSFKSVTEMWWI